MKNNWETRVLAHLITWAICSVLLLAAAIAMGNIIVILAVIGVSIYWLVGGF